MTYRLASAGFNKKTFGPFFGEEFTTPPLASSITIGGYTSAGSKSDITDGLLLSTDYGGGGTNRTSFLINAPTAPYTLKICVVVLPSISNTTLSSVTGESVWGVCFKMSGGQYIELKNILNSTTSNLGSGYAGLHYSVLNSYNNFSNGWSLVRTDLAAFAPAYMWMSLTDPGGVGNLKIGIGLDSRYMQEIDAGSRTAFGSPPNQIGIITQNTLQTDTSHPMRIIVQSWEIT